MTAAVSPLDGSLFGPGQPCFGCAPDHPAGFHLSFVLDGDGVLTRFTPGRHHQGPAGLMHGGLISTLADEAAAWAILAKLGKFGFTTKFEARFVKGVKIGVECEARAWLTKISTRVVQAKVAITQDGPCFEGDFSFVLLDKTGAEKLMGQEMKPEWVRFCR